MTFPKASQALFVLMAILGVFTRTFDAAVVGKGGKATDTVDFVEVAQQMPERS